MKMLCLPLVQPAFYVTRRSLTKELQQSQTCKGKAKDANLDPRRVGSNRIQALLKRKRKPRSVLVLRNISISYTTQKRTCLEERDSLLVILLGRKGFKCVLKRCDEPRGQNIGASTHSNDIGERKVP
jgi:hypothetical protein